MTDGFVPTNVGRRANYEFTQIHQRLKALERKNQRAFCGSCLRRDFDASATKPDESYFEGMALAREREHTATVKGETKVVAFEREYKCANGHRVSLMLDNEERAAKKARA